MKIKTHVIDLMSLGCTTVGEGGAVAWETLRFPLKEKLESRTFSERRVSPRHLRMLPAEKSKVCVGCKHSGHEVSKRELLPSTKWYPVVVSDWMVMWDGRRFGNPRKSLAKQSFRAVAQFRKESVNTQERFFNTEPFTPGFMVAQPAEDSVDDMFQRVCELPVVVRPRQVRVTTKPPSGTILERVAALRAKKAGVSVVEERTERNWQRKQCMQAWAMLAETDSSLDEYWGESVSVAKARIAASITLPARVPVRPPLESIPF